MSRGMKIIVAGNVAMAAFNFGIWQHSYSAGAFMLCTLFIFASKESP
jgi:hypothetical protein